MAGTKDPKATYIDYSARAWSTTADGIFAEAGQVLDRTQNKDQQAINAEVKANLARIEGIAGSAAAGAYVFKGSLNGLADLLLLTNVKVGDVYNIKSEFELSSELNPGGGNVKYPAGTNVAATKAMATSTGDGWDALGGVTLDLDPINQKISNLESGKYDANKVVTTSATNDDAHVLTAKATHYVANSAATTAVNTFKTTNFDLLNEQVSKMEVNKADTTYVDNTFATKDELKAKVVNDKADKTSTDKALSAKATHEAIQEAVNVVAPDVSDLTTSVAGIKKFVTVPFDGFETGAVNIEEMSCTNVSKIVYVIQKKVFAAKGTDGKFYNSWAPQDDGRNRDLYIEGLNNTLTKKFYVYKNEIYSVRGSLGLSLMLGQPITLQATGNDDTRSISQRLFTQEIAKYASISALNTLTNRVTALENLLKLT